MTDNIAIFRESAANSGLLSESFLHDTDSLVISAIPEKPNALQTSARKIRECLAALKCLETHPNAIRESVYEQLVDALETEGTNFTEFVSFWAVLDLNYSIYRKFSREEKIRIVEALSDAYLSHRYPIYNLYGVTDTILQVRADQSAHKKNGRTGIRQMRQILTRCGFEEYDGKEDFVRRRGNVFLAVDEHKAAFSESLKELGAVFAWQGQHQNKLPDLMMKAGQRFWIVEHKHMKESGGGQDKQLTELVELIKCVEQRAKNLAYIAFLDGQLFRNFAKANLSGKLGATRNAIIATLKKRPKNYFVNAFGFQKVVSEMMTK